MSGYLYRNAVLYYDSQTETFWSQMTGDAVMGPLTGKRLKWMPSETTIWKKWRKKHPNTTVLRPPNSLGSYRRTNQFYDRYRKSPRLMFPTGPDPISGKYPKKSRVTILVRDGKARCYPHKALVEGENADGDLRIVKQGRTVRVETKDGKILPTMHGLWFAWCEFYPEGTVWEPKE